MTVKGLTSSGSGWERLAGGGAQGPPGGEGDGVWIFAPVRRGSREWGTAVLSRVDGERRRIYTAGYVLAIKGKERGKFESTILEVGTGPLEALAPVLQEAQAPLDDNHPPIAVAVESWFSTSAAPGAAHHGS